MDSYCLKGRVTSKRDEDRSMRTMNQYEAKKNCSHSLSGVRSTLSLLPWDSGRRESGGREKEGREEHNIYDRKSPVMIEA